MLRRHGYDTLSLMIVSQRMEAQNFAAENTHGVPLSLAKGRPRLLREWKTIRAMTYIYCEELHGHKPGLCAECQGLLNYASIRLDRCRFGEEKPTCAKCPVHC